MIVPCECGAKLKIDPAKVEDHDVRVRCPRCGNILTVSKKAAAPAAPRHVVPSPPPSPSPSFPPPAAERRDLPLVLIAHDSDMVREMVGGVLLDAGFKIEHASDGIEALAKAGEQLPKIMIIDVGLPGIYGFELCERLKSERATSGIKIILLASVYGITRYKRKPTSLYGADDYIEKHHIADSLVPKINSLLEDKGTAGVPAPDGHDHRESAVTPPPPARKPEPELFRPESLAMDGSDRRGTGEQAASVMFSGPEDADSAQSPEAQEIAPDSYSLESSVFDKEECDIPSVEATDPEAVEKAKRFARIIVSDIALYNQEAVIEGVKKGTFYELLKNDVDEGRQLYEARIPAAIRAKRDYYGETIENFIASQKKIVR